MIRNELFSSKEAIDYDELIVEIGLLTFLGWKFTFSHNPYTNVFEVIANYKHFFRSRKFIEQDTFYDWALYRMIQRVYAVMREYQWQYPKYKKYLEEKEGFEIKQKAKDDDDAISNWDSDSTCHWVLDREHYRENENDSED